MRLYLYLLGMETGRSPKDNKEIKISKRTHEISILSSVLDIGVGFIKSTEAKEDLFQNCLYKMAKYPLKYINLVHI